MTSQVIELRQASADKVNDNGDYIVNLPYNKRLTISEGDVVQVKNTFIDTEASTSQKINIEDTMTLSFSIAKYFMYTRNDNLVDLVNIPMVTDPNYDYYTLSTILAQNNDFYEVSQLQDIHDGGENSVITVNYVNEVGQDQVRQYPAVRSSSSSNIYYADCFFIYDSTKPITFKSSAPNAQVSISKERTLVGDRIVPIEETIQIKIEPGNYTPNSIASSFCVFIFIASLPSHFTKSVLLSLPVYPLKNGDAPNWSSPAELPPSDNLFVKTCAKSAGV